MTTAVRDEAAAQVGPAPRLHWIDWLRVLAIASVFIYHTLRPFDSTGWHVKNAETSDLIGASQIFFSTFGLAVLFLLAGAGVWFALRKRTPRMFVRERAARLLVPFVVGSLLLSPIQGFIEETYQGIATSTLPDYLGWWSGAIAWAVGRGVSPTVFGVGYHLWFLGFLFAFSVIGVPIFVALRRPRGAGAISALASRVAAYPGATLVFAVPVALLLIGLAPLGTDENDWSSFGWYFGYFVIGFVLLADDRFLAAVRRDLPIILIAAVGSTAALLALDFGEWLFNSASRGLNARSLAIALTFAFEGWAWTLVVLNIGMRLPRLQRPVSPRLAEAVLPVYVIHQPVILAVAFLVVQWPLGIMPKWAVVFGVSLAITLGLVELGLQHRLTRILLGARVQPAAAAAAGAATVGGDVTGATPPARPTTRAGHA